MRHKAGALVLLEASIVTVAVGGTGLLAGVAGAAQGIPRSPAVPLDAVSAIIGAFREHPIVALEEPHGDERSHAFRLELIRDPRFALAVNDIVVEFGNSRYQKVIEAFVDGGRVADSDLKKVWQNTTQAHTVWDRPIYGDFFRAVRALNATLPRDRRLRVLLGDPPIDWNAVRTPEDRRKWLSMGRSTYPVGIIGRDVLDKGRRALVVYGAYHLIRNNLAGPNLSERLELATGIRPFVVLTHPTGNLEVVGVDPSAVPIPSVTLTKGTTLEGQMDAILYLGPPGGDTVSRLAPSLCADPDYRSMRMQRMLLAGIADAESQLKEECSQRR